jgi:hypothetical protein
MFAGIDAKTGRPLLHFPYEAIRLVMVPIKPDHEEELRRLGLFKKGDINDTSAKRWSIRRNAYTLDDNDDTSASENDRLINDPDDEVEIAAGELERLYATGDILPKLLTRGHLYAEHPPNMDELYEEYHRISEEMEMGLLDDWDDVDQHNATNKKRGVWNGGSGASNKKPFSPLPPANYVMAVGDDVYRRMFREVSEARSMPCGLFFCGHHEDVAHPSIGIATTLVMVLFGTLSYLAFYTENFVDD